MSTGFFKFLVKSAISQDIGLCNISNHNAYAYKLSTKIKLPVKNKEFWKKFLIFFFEKIPEHSLRVLQKSFCQPEMFCIFVVDFLYSLTGEEQNFCAGAAHKNRGMGGDDKLSALLLQFFYYYQ